MQTSGHISAQKPHAVHLSSSIWRAGWKPRAFIVSESAKAFCGQK